MSHGTHAQPFQFGCTPGESDGQRVGVLLSHGFTGSPASMVPWGKHLAGEGFGVDVPCLPGHGTTWKDMNATSWKDWYAELGLAFDKLQANCDQVVVGGLSMGGGLALKLAAERGSDVAGVILVNAAVASNNKQLLAVPLLKRVIASMPGIGNDIKKPGQDEYGYDRVPLKALGSMMTAWKEVRRDLPKVTQPILLFRSAEDHVVDPSSARIIASKVSSRDVQERILQNSYHVATLDNDAPAIFEESVEFIRRVTGP
ncbi:MAG TPA: alpha/beta fold hydrolase [Nocardioidaceae bacterium]|nr:alpha/beta fold hydrolase [Nocardioidaceae bacterium]